ncbi:MAG: hypothetical protein LBF37_00590 [Rickettsiales bacterium]|jgi:NH3-dependent NAD+ synthetase|nr:hypothetical protein [Rickettsiales bacterium]
MINRIRRSGRNHNIRSRINIHAKAFLKPIGNRIEQDAFKAYIRTYGANAALLIDTYPQIPRGVITRPASAELSAGQKDSDSLPPYDVSDAILRHIENGTESMAEDKKLLETF